MLVGVFAIVAGALDLLAFIFSTKRKVWMLLLGVFLLASGIFRITL